MKRDDESALESIYAGAREVFLRGEHDRALDRFKSVYEVDCTFRDASEIINDYYDLPPDVWVAKYAARFHDQKG